MGGDSERPVGSVELVFARTKIELIMEPSNSDYSRDVCQQDHVVKHEKAVDRLLAGRRPDIFRWIAAILIFALFAWVIVEYFDFF